MLKCLNNIQGVQKLYPIFLNNFQTFFTITLKFSWFLLHYLPHLATKFQVTGINIFDFIVN